MPPAGCSWSHSPVAPGAVVPWSYGPVVPWFRACSPLFLWSRGRLLLLSCFLALLVSCSLALSLFCYLALLLSALLFCRSLAILRPCALARALALALASPFATFLFPFHCFHACLSSLCLLLICRCACLMFMLFTSWVVAVRHLRCETCATHVLNMCATCARHACCCAVSVSVFVPVCGCASALRMGHVVCLVTLLRGEGAQRRSVAVQRQTSA